jgi:transcriptional regulator with XRE-family HTH domain
MNNFAKKLTDLMKEHGTSQNQLAIILSVKQQTISRYINGEREPNIDTILEIAKYFDVSTDYLLGLED